MAIRMYEENGKKLWRIYVNMRSKFDPTIREQKHALGFQSEPAALAEEKRLLRKLSEEVARRERQGITWETVIDRWELELKNRNYSGIDPLTASDNISALRRWTEAWLKRSASDLTRGDARQIFDALDLQEKSKSFQMRVKSAINTVFTWGIEERLIKGVHQSPVGGLQLSKRKEEKLPEILTIEEIRRLLFEAKRSDHAWYPVWVMALLTGMRNGELYALTWSDVDLENRRITVSKSYNTRLRIVKSTKAGYWRTVPVSSDAASASDGDQDSSRQSRSCTASALGMG